MSTIAAPTTSRRTDTVTAQIVVACEADLSDPFTRFARVPRPGRPDESRGAGRGHAYGTATAAFGLVTA